MTKKEKDKIREYLYPTFEEEDFLVNVIYQDLKEIIPQNICICSKNLTSKIRKSHYNEVYDYIYDYLHQHQKYCDYLMSEYPLDMDEDLIDDLIINFVFCLSQENAIYKDIHIFKNRKSICFTDVSILDMF